VTSGETGVKIGDRERLRVAHDDKWWRAGFAAREDDEERLTPNLDRSTPGYTGRSR
jgi:hypothetical protein